MRLASVSFNSRLEQIGGGHVPAVAFQEWCKLLGVECDLLDSEAIEWEDLDSYDGVFFATPPGDGALALNVPYVVMIHAEFDQYDPEVMERAVQIVTIDQDKKFWPWEDTLYWHPCCRPKHLLTGDEVFHGAKRGTLYAARVSTWKNANTLIAYSNLNDFQDHYGPVLIYGRANNSEFGQFVDTALGKHIRFDELFTPDSLQKEYMWSDFFWDVSGTNQYMLDIKRLNLAAFEAMKYGCIPIVNKDAIPRALHDITIDFREVLPYNRYPLYRKELRKRILEKARYEYFGFEAVKKQVETIIEAFK